MKYLSAVSQPFNPTSYGACVPQNNFRPSRKTHAKSFITITIGTGGIGYGLFAPTLSSDGPVGWVTTAAYTGVVTDNLSASAIGVNPCYNPSNPYTGAELVDVSIANSRPSATGRMVSFGLRWRYIGTTLNQGGIEAIYVDPNHNTVEGISMNVILAFQETRVIGTTKAIRETAAFGISTEEMEFPYVTSTNVGTDESIIASYPFSSGTPASTSTSIGAPVIALCFSGVAGNQYFVEYIAHNEYMGILAQSGLTPNSSDPQGTDMVRAAASRAMSNNIDNSKSLLQRVTSEMASIAKETRPIFVAAAKQIAYNGLSRAVGMSSALTVM